eukprot:jgi/Orpsp1_1/1179113/evm.model.c7180000067984.1
MKNVNGQPQVVVYQEVAKFINHTFKPVSEVNLVILNLLSRIVKIIRLFPTIQLIHIIPFLLPHQRWLPVKNTLLLQVILLLLLKLTLLLLVM